MDADHQAEFLDLDAYAAGYVGRGRVTRLLFIADNATTASLALEALRLAHNAAKQGDDMARYKHITDKIASRLGPQYGFDGTHAEAVTRRVQQRQDKLEHDLSTYKTNIVKESIRLCYHDLGDHFHACGDLQSAFKSYVRARDYCTTGKHVVHMCLSVVRVSIEMGNYVHVTNYAQKAEQVPDVQKDPAVMSKVQAALGLAQLSSRKYKQAAKHFAMVHSDLGSGFNEVLSPADIAAYGALCALASFDRRELHSHVISNIAFREYLEAHPQVREAVYDFQASKYSSCLEALKRLLPQLRLDLYLQPHTDAMYKQIRNRALIQYTMPFTSVKLDAMASAFSTTAGELEHELAVLIQEGQVQARIDSHHKVLYARHADKRSSTFQQALQIGEDFIRDANALLLRASVLQHDLIQRTPTGSSHGGSSAARGRGASILPFGLLS